MTPPKSLPLFGCPTTTATCVWPPLTSSGFGRFWSSQEKRDGRERERGRGREQRATASNACLMPSSLERQSPTHSSATCQSPDASIMQPASASQTFLPPQLASPSCARCLLEAPDAALTTPPPRYAPASSQHQPNRHALQVLAFDSSYASLRSLTRPWFRPATPNAKVVVSVSQLSKQGQARPCKYEAQTPQMIKAVAGLGVCAWGIYSYIYKRYAYKYVQTNDKQLARRPQVF